MKKVGGQRGFGLVGFVALLPVLLGVLCLISGVALLFKTDAHLKQECRTSVLNSQREVAQNLKRLLALNAQAERLRAARAAAEANLRAAIIAGGPAGIAAAETILATVEAQQSALAVQQRVLLVKARAESLAAPLKAKSLVMQGLRSDVHEANGRFPAAVTHTRAGLFDVIAMPKGDVTPNYVPSKDFTQQQTVDVDISFELASLLPEWLRNLLPTRGLTVTTHCQATIDRQEDEWVETLNAVR